MIKDDDGSQPLTRRRQQAWSPSKWTSLSESSLIFGKEAPGCNLNNSWLKQNNQQTNKQAMQVPQWELSYLWKSGSGLQSALAWLEQTNKQTTKGIQKIERVKSGTYPIWTWTTPIWTAPIWTAPIWTAPIWTTPIWSYLKTSKLGLWRLKGCYAKKG